jgi:hypothetical protein
VSAVPIGPPFLDRRIPTGSSGGACAAQKKQRRAARVERRVKELAALGGRLDPKDPFELQGKLKAELASLGRFDDSLARVTAQCAAFEASVRDWAANTAAAEESDEEEWQEVELPTITSEMILSIQAEVTPNSATLQYNTSATGGEGSANVVVLVRWNASLSAGWSSTTVRCTSYNVGR